LRDRLLELDPLGLPHVREVNQAEAAFWEASSGHRIDDSVNVLGFDCGGQQWVLEVCLPIGELVHSSGRDLEFIGKLLAVIEESQIPAHCPIEQRWTARSTAAMSPAYSSNSRDVFSWVGIIMYLPPHGDQQRRLITDKFREYARAIEPLVEEFGGKIHWYVLYVLLQLLDIDSFAHQ
jgi:L-galactono-1,4-lactone dehydrogenase